MTIPGIRSEPLRSSSPRSVSTWTGSPRPQHLASWAGMCPGNNESAGKHRSGKTRKGDPWLQSALVEAAWSASRTKSTSMQARFWRIAKRRGDEKAIYAVGHHLLIVIWWMLHETRPYSEMGDDYLGRRIDPENEHDNSSTSSNNSD